jgi:phosphate transport system permease protein
MSVSERADLGMDDGKPGRHLVARHRKGRLWLAFFLLATLIAIITLSALVLTVLDDSMGLVAYRLAVPEAELSPDGRPVAELTQLELAAILRARLTAQRLVAIDRDKPLSSRSQSDTYRLVESAVLKPDVVATYGALDSVLNGARIEAEVGTRWPDAALTWRRWWNWRFVTSPQSADPLNAGVRTAILGSLWMILITIAVAFPIGVGAGIYLEEYADRRRRVNRIIQTNINNLAGVPSIIYGILGLTVFVRLLEPITSGAVFGAGDPTTANGRTIVSAGLTMALLILPILIIATQEAIRTVPPSLREASYGLGATKWQTVWHHVLPTALPGILTGTILSVSRALGETAPLVVIGASTYIATDPAGPFAKFTVLPMQIYQWTSRPQAEFRDLAAAAILVLLGLLLALNATAVVLRNRYTVRY